MNQPAAFKATVHGIRTVPSRKVLQIVVETAIEELPHVAQIAEHGAWLAIARLAPEGAAPATSGQEWEAPSGTTPPTPLQPSDKPEKRKWSELPLSQQAAIRCSEKRFRQFLKEHCHQGWIEDTADAATYIRNICRVGSRADLDGTPASAEAWRRLNDSFEAWFLADKIGVLA